MAHHLNVILDASLKRALAAYVAATGQTVSDAVRDLLRVALKTVKTTRDRGWIQGRHEAYVAVREAVARAVADIPETPE